MYFYIDESGHTGPNLFDEAQPVLYYGIISSEHDLDVSTLSILKRAKQKLGVSELHATDLGIGKLAVIADELMQIQLQNDVRFDINFVEKDDHALICFFDQVFDQGLNPAVTWTGYWTPLRYILLMKVAYLFDLETLKKAWKARIELNNAKANQLLIEVCTTIRARIENLPDKRSRELIYDALTWAMQNPGELHYNCYSRDDLLSVTPNLIGFQTVMFGIARRIAAPNGASKIIVDEQSQFNKAQKTLAEFYASARSVPWVTGPGLPKMDLQNIPNIPITFRSGKYSAGLELVDIYLWVFKRWIEKKPLPEALLPLIVSQLEIGTIDGVSLSSITERWGKWFDELPEEPTAEQRRIAEEMMAQEEARRWKAPPDTSK